MQLRLQLRELRELRLLITKQQLPQALKVGYDRGLVAELFAARQFELALQAHRELGEQRSEILASDLLRAQFALRPIQCRIGLAGLIGQGRFELGVVAVQTIVERFEIVTQGFSGLVDFATLSACGLEQAGFETVDRAGAIAHLLALLSSQFFELVGEAFVECGETLVGILAQAFEFAFELLMQLLETLLVIAHLAAEKNVADLRDIVLFIGAAIALGILVGHVVFLLAQDHACIRAPRCQGVRFRVIISNSGSGV
jgi:hypothetical protein